MSERILKRTRLLIALAILSSMIGCDQATKQIATATLKDGPAQTCLNGTVRFGYALNSGGFLSLGASLPPHVRTWIFTGLNAVLLTAMAVWLTKNWKTNLAVFASLCCILAGGIGNVTDRVTNHGLVVDFINLGVGPIHTGIFNVADIGVTFGALTLVICSRKSLSG